MMPGSLGKYYASHGGEVCIMGKPDAVIYTAAMADLGCQPSELLAIGDSMEHDIGGAHAAGIASLFVAGTFCLLAHMTFDHVFGGAVAVYGVLGCVSV